MLCSAHAAQANPTRGLLVNRIRAALVVVFTVAGSVAALIAAAAPSSGAAVAASRAATVRLEQTALGEILVNGSGHTLYVFTRDRHNKDSCAKVAGCLETWPALTTTRRPLAGPNVRASLLGTIKLHGRVRQVTYAGHPLYTYALEFGRRSTFNIGADQYGGAWDAVNAAGEAVN
jgi:predicted lipoprotein with Yx(FWY)xxD motif